LKDFGEKLDPIYILRLLCLLNNEKNGSQKTSGHSCNQSFMSEMVVTYTRVTAMQVERNEQIQEICWR